MAKNNRRSIGFDPTMGLEDTIQTINRRSSSILSTEGVKLDPAMSKAVSDILTDSMENYDYYLGEAKVLATEAWVIGLSAEEDVQDRNRNIRNARAIAKATGREDWEIWRSMEDMEDVKDFGKRIWEKIKAAIKKLILMIINLIKSIGNFIKGAACKAQEFFYKKYAGKILKGGVDKLEGSKKTVKAKSVSATKVFKEKGRPDMVLNAICSGVQTMTKQIMDTNMSIANGAEKGFKKENKETDFGAGDVLSGLGDNLDSKKVEEQAGRWFPSAARVINMACYGSEKPSKNSIAADVYIKDAWEMLAPATLQKLQYAFKTGQTLNKTLEKQLGFLTKMEKASAYGYDKSEKEENKPYIRQTAEGMMKARRALHFLSTLLLQAYGEALAVRWKVFVAAKKYVKGGKKDAGDSNKPEEKKEGQ